MGKILQFPQLHSNAYLNLQQLFDVAESPCVCSFYLEALENSRSNLLPGEYKELLSVGRRRRIELAAPKKKLAATVTGPGEYFYCPENGEERPACEMVATPSYRTGHYYIETPEQLKGRGIRFLRIIDGENLYPRHQFKAGWNEYCVTELAYKKLCEKYSISVETTYN